MALKPNYHQDRMERDRRARIKKAEKLQAREEKSLQRKAEQDPKAETSPEDAGK